MEELLLLRPLSSLAGDVGEVGPIGKPELAGAFWMGSSAEVVLLASSWSDNVPPPPSPVPPSEVAVATRRWTPPAAKLSWSFVGGDFLFEDMLLKQEKSAKNVKTSISDQICKLLAKYWSHTKTIPSIVQTLGHARLVFRT